ncbi:MAG: glycosyltransferase [Lachnospiraceae bacterium]|nr:glycosyltransferase [Lachnospiraceae bacterium]
MNIVIIPAFFQSKNRPTLGSFFLEQAIALKKAGNQVTILYCDTYSVKCVKEWLAYQEEPASQIQGVQIYRERCFCPFKHGMEGYKEAFAKGIAHLWGKYIKNQSVEIIHAHCCVWAGYAAMKLSEKTKLPYVITEHATMFQLHRNEISSSNNDVMREVFQKAAKVICVSRAFAKLLGEYANHIEVIGNVVDCEQFQTSKNNAGVHEGCRFLTVCYMEEEAQLYKKGIDVLIRAWAQVAPKHPKSELIIGGGGKAKEKVVEWIKEYQVTESVRLPGALERSEVVEQMQLCDCFVLPSRYETFGVVYIEAMACGKPVIAAANGGPDDFVHAFNGILVEPEHEEELVQALEKMIEAAGQQNSPYQPDRIAAYVKEKFSYQAIAGQLEEVYKTVIEQRKSWGGA